jgi:hypothetical protein
VSQVLGKLKCLTCVRHFGFYFASKDWQQVLSIDLALQLQAPTSIAFFVQ